ncbi:uncharacterized protein apof [Astyanax mexicanus]|uniref:uncharacterized protein apof n=1 Tax=Astyanax mexicanus TaxID=7994 RepID=UPI0020CB12AF|nr:uncharacterized protein apof [Astyanax mexicanus]
MMVRNSKLKWLLLIHFLLCDMSHARAPPPSDLKNGLGPGISLVSVSPVSSPLLQMALKLDTEHKQKATSGDEDTLSMAEEPNVDSAHQFVSNLAPSLQDLVHLQGNVSCAELAAGPWGGEDFSQELLGLVMVPVLISAQCLSEAQSLVMNLYGLLGQNDTQELVKDIVTLIKLGKNSSPHIYSSSPRITSGYSQRHLQAVMFNIQQLADAGDENMGGISGQNNLCQGWVKVKGTQLLGKTANHAEHLHLSKAKQVCQSLGINCAGVTKVEESNPKMYRVILRPGSRVFPTASRNQSESWIQKCGVESVRWRRHAVPQLHTCKNAKEERVYNVVEWIPGVSTLYNLGTAVYYASVNCSSTAKERAILSAVDLGTDALMAVTGGAAGVAGYALGAGLKTGVKAGIKYLLNNMEEGDLVMNQESWEDGTITIQ